MSVDVYARNDMDQILASLLLMSCERIASNSGQRFFARRNVAACHFLRPFLLISLRGIRVCRGGNVRADSHTTCGDRAWAGRFPQALIRLLHDVFSCYLFDCFVLVRMLFACIQPPKSQIAHSRLGVYLDWCR